MTALDTNILIYACDKADPAGQAHPELICRPLRPEPLFLGLVAATIQRAYPEGLETPAAGAADSKRVSTAN